MGVTNFVFLKNDFFLIKGERLLKEDYLCNIRYKLWLYTFLNTVVLKEFA